MGARAVMGFHLCCAEPRMFHQRRRRIRRSLVEGCCAPSLSLSQSSPLTQIWWQTTSRSQKELDSSKSSHADVEHCSGVAVDKPSNPLYDGDWEERVVTYLCYMLG